MDSVGQKLLELGKKELGYGERSDGSTKFGEWYTKNVDEDHNPYFDDAPWCDMFLAYLADKAGVTDQAGEFASTQQHAQWFKDQGATTSKPEPGAIVFYDWTGNKDLGSISHVGIVIEVYANGKFKALEGNAEDQVKYKIRDVDSVATFALPSKVKVATSAKPEAGYAPKHAAPAPTVDQLTQAPAVVTTSGQAQEVADGGSYELPVKEAALTGAVGIVVLAVLALGMAK
ncbi:CHAP domain-containing protein, partial [Actinocorallia lasiicapitis]